ncbi:FtsB family cell division protein [Cellulosilyticum sp. I15G10I2]|uniref:FtsB family cell division protein n=1 Tax=Cellulosilyticum sp. I15G10I2 TaxID=1892843 RepID=UPI00085BB9E3|nr:septum formation initiator family protein [Cellulosilyticum sp. I15G10I2]
MKKIKQNIFRLTFIITILIVVILGMKGYQLNKLIKRVDHQISMDKKELGINAEQLKSLQNEITQMDTLEYIEKVAREELGMVKESDIVFREKQ